jgi:aminoglycoside phosphotransferase (APT) family kinase protein
MLRTVAESDLPTALSVLEPLGELVAAVHEIQVNGFGNLTPELTGTHASYSVWFIDMFIDSHLHETLAAAADDQDALGLVHLAVERMAAQRDPLDTVTCRLAHGDLSPDNVLVESGRITGIVDWEAVKGAPQANDFAWWTTISAVEALSVDRLLTGYQRVLALEEDFWPVFGLARLRILSGLLGYAAKVGDAILLARASDGLRRILAEKSMDG